MARYHGPKDRLSRREGFDIFGAGAKLTRLSVPPGMHGPKGARKLSGFGKQLREKQKVKRIYGVLEHQFKKYVNRASKNKGNTGDVLLSLLERRLDNVVYRLGFASSRPFARQIVAHGHVFVNNRKVSVPSFEVKKGDVVSLTPKIQKNPDVAQMIKDDMSMPEWLERKVGAGHVARLPERTDVVEPIEESIIIEYYSR